MYNFVIQSVTRAASLNTTMLNHDKYKVYEHNPQWHLRNDAAIIDDKHCKSIQNKSTNIVK